MKVKKTFLSIKIVASWGFRNFVLMYEPKPECVILFSECNYQGERYEVCADSPSFSSVIFSIFLLISSPKSQCQLNPFNFLKIWLSQASLKNNIKAEKLDSQQIKIASIHIASALNNCIRNIQLSKNHPWWQTSEEKA